jgi:hypothetical protein
LRRSTAAGGAGAVTVRVASVPALVGAPTDLARVGTLVRGRRRRSGGGSRLGNTVTGRVGALALESTQRDGDNVAAGGAGALLKLRASGLELGRRRDTSVGESGRAREGKDDEGREELHVEYGRAHGVLPIGRGGGVCVGRWSVVEPFVSSVRFAVCDNDVGLIEVRYR